MKKLLLALGIFVFCISVTAFGGEPLNVLLLNDDGIEAEGLQTLKGRLEDAGHLVTVVAPSGNASASSSGVNLGEVFTITPFDVGEDIENEFAVSRITQDQETIDPVPATPVDCLVASASILDEPPDLIIFGINDQHNTGGGTQVSGTVGGALGGASKLSPYDSLPSIAINLERVFFSDPEEPSAEFEKAFPDAADFIVRLVERLQDSAARSGGSLLPDGIMLNINYPARPLESIKGVKLRRQGLVRFDDGSGAFSVQGVRSTPQVLSQYPSGVVQILSVPLLIDPNEGARKADTSDLVNGYVTIVPLDGDLTAGSSKRKLIKRLLGNADSLLSGEGN